MEQHIVDLELELLELHKTIGLDPVEIQEEPELVQKKPF